MSIDLVTLNRLEFFDRVTVVERRERKPDMNSLRDV